MELDRINAKALHIGRSIVWPLAVALALSLAGGQAYAASGFLSDRHVAAGMKCDSCHENVAKPADVPMSRCLTCHESYEKLKLSEKAKQHHPNPHAGHFIDLECNNCHHGHKADENFCDQCHAKASP